MGNTTIKNNTRHVSVMIQQTISVPASRKLSVGRFGHLRMTFADGVKARNIFRVAKTTCNLKTVSELVSCVSHFQLNS